MRGWALAQPHPNWENTPPSPPSCLSPPGVSPPHTSTPSSYTASPQPHRPGTASQSRSQNKVCPPSVPPPSSLLILPGYLVTAPDLLGHGTANRSSDYSLSALADALRPLFASARFDLVIGHSLGGLVALALIPLLPPTHPIPCILVDPPLEQSDRTLDKNVPKYVDEVTNVRSVQRYQADNPRWSREDAVWKVLSAHLCDADTITGVFAQNRPWSFTHLLGQVPPHVKTTILAADPALHPAFKVETAAPYPHINTIVVPGTTHSIQRDFPNVVVDVALAEAAKLGAKL
ncbi:hypothetical protein SERLA73DRAFT_80206 [Serpula lacrymans var. lacrymans S7.3]|uniref:AB hydrolase-1 domain-containing protein n=1 Tax=Serpula lacrymans var. lacrymans (strain S7.3) TaxID=936435 RepID=F8QJ25_SERL3|nr:hypothetical protein SERLA73DRAFT_80206 [Serpula lacrymans var. lacrymans S7.3]